MLECDNCSLIVGLDNDLGMSQPFDIRHSELGAVVLLVITLLRHHMSEEILTLHAPDQHALKNFAIAPCFGYSFVTKLIALAQGLSRRSPGLLKSCI